MALGAIGGGLAHSLSTFLTNEISLLLVQPCSSIGLTTVFGGGVDGEDDWVREGLREVDLGVRQRPLPRRDGLLLR